MRCLCGVKLQFNRPRWFWRRPSCCACRMGRRPQTPGPADPVDPLKRSITPGSGRRIRRCSAGGRSFHSSRLPAARRRSVEPHAAGRRSRQIGDCSAWAVAYAARSYYTGTRENRNIRLATNLPSPNYVYHLARQKVATPAAASARSSTSSSTARCRWRIIRTRPMPAAGGAARWWRAPTILRSRREPRRHHQPDDIKGQLSRETTRSSSEFQCQHRLDAAARPQVFTER